MKLRAALLAVTVLALVAPARADQPAAPTPAPALTEIEPALYAVRDADSTIYLFGTVHIRRPGSQWGGANARAALTEADEVWTELEITDDAQARAQVLVMQLGMAPADQPLSSFLTAEENAKLAGLTQRLNVPATMFERMRPWLAAITLSMMPMLQAGYETAAGVDNAIDAVAAANGQQTRAFETIEQQIGFLANLPPEVQRQMLVDALSQTEMAQEEFDMLSTAWERGDVETLERLVVDDTRLQYPDVYRVLFVERNNAWMDVLTRELDGSGVDFVAVGAGHMLGPDGLVEQFRARGLTVERVSPAEEASR
jgi:uncharacterized protein